MTAWYLIHHDIYSTSHHRLVLTDNDDTDFENGHLGMWSNSKSDNLDWRFHRSYTQTINTGPSADHTTGLGLYFCIASIRRMRI